MSAAIKLTPTEASIAAWAIDPMADYGEELLEHDPGEAWGPEAVPVLTGRLLDMSAVTRSPMKDFLDRVGDQYVDMMSEYEHFYFDNCDKGMDSDRAMSAAKSRARRESAAADSLVAKVKAACQSPAK
jgi:hypothetical protein